MSDKKNTKSNVIKSNEKYDPSIDKKDLKIAKQNPESIKYKTCMDRIFTRRNNITESANFVYQLIYITLYFDVLVKKKLAIN